MYVVCLKAASTLEGKKEKESWEGGQEGGGVGRQNGRAGKGQGARGQVGRRAAVVAGSRQRKPLGLQEARGPHLEARAGGRWWRLGGSDKVATKE